MCLARELLERRTQLCCQLVLSPQQTLRTLLENGPRPSRCGLQGTIETKTAVASQLRRSSELSVGAPPSKQRLPPKQSAACSWSHDQNRSALISSDRVLLSWLEEQWPAVIYVLYLSDFWIFGRCYGTWSKCLPRYLTTNLTKVISK